MANTFGTDILIQAEDPMKAANFYVRELGFEICRRLRAGRQSADAEDARKIRIRRAPRSLRNALNI